MARQTSIKRGVQSGARKQATTRHGEATARSTRKKPGAFGRERGQPRRVA